MNDSANMLAALIAAPPEEQTRFPPTSRYFGVAARTRTLPDGREATHLVPRVMPAEDSFNVLAVHIVVPPERTDTLAAQYFGDAQSWWRIADANAPRIPEELTLEPGTEVTIAVSEEAG